MSALLLASNGGSVPAIDLTEGLIAHYLLNNNADDSHGVYDGTPNGGVDFQGDIALFDGISDSITLDDTYGIASTDTVTISFWAKTLDSSPSYYLSNLSSSSNTEMIIAMLNDKLYVYQKDYSGTLKYRYYISTNTVITDYDKVYNITTILYPDATVQKVFVNGTEIEMSLSLQLGTITQNCFSGALTKRLYQDGLNAYFQGGMSNLRIYNTEKNQAFITALHEESYYPKPLPLPTTDGLVAHYPLTGTAEDETGNYDGVENGVTYVDDSEFGSVANFDGSDYVDISANNSYENQDYTISAWINPNNIVGDKGIFSTFYSDSNSDYFGQAFRIVDNSISMAHLNGGTWATENQIIVGSISASKFTHILCSCVNNLVTIYIDDILVGSKTLPSIVWNAVKTQFIGSKSGVIGTINNYMDGRISDVRYYNRALTTQERTDIYNYEKNFRPIDIDDGLVAFYPLANNSLDNYGAPSEYDGTDTAMTYDGVSGVFNGLTSSVATAYSGFTNNNSLSFWTNTLNTAINPVNALIDTNNNATTYAGLLLAVGDDNTFELTQCNNVSQGSADRKTYRSITTYDWTAPHHISIVYRGFDDFDVYIDNVLVSMTYTSGTCTSIVYNGSLKIGGGLSYNNLVYSEVKISHIRPYNKVITAEQVAVIYNTEKGDFI